MWEGSSAAADGQALETGGIATSILHGEGVPLAPWAGYVLAVAIFGAALAARFAMLPVEGGLGFLTFYPAVALAALLFGTGPGLLTMVLGAVTALYIFMPPFWAFKLVFEQMLSVATFSFSGAIICFLTHQMRHHAEELKSTMAALQRRESELARANERLQDLDRAKSEFFSNVSHEFRTPLTLMLGPLENLLAEPAGTRSEESRKTLELVHRNALRLLRLVNALLDFSRMEAGRVQPNREATDLAAFTAELASHFSSACTGGGVQLIVDCPPLPHAVGVDRAMWEKIVLNLLSNAFKFTFAGSIEVRLRDLDEQAVLTVRDTGTGIPRHELPHLFERFHRVEGARGRSFEGTGIGLALIHELVRLHGGSVAVDSEQGCGSTFTVRVPFGTESHCRRGPALAAGTRGDGNRTDDDCARPGGGGRRRGGAGRLRDAPARPGAVRRDDAGPRRLRRAQAAARRRSHGHAARHFAFGAGGGGSEGRGLGGGACRPAGETGDRTAVATGRNVYHHITEGILATQPDGTIVSVNPSLCLMTGYSGAELIGANPRIFQSGRYESVFYQTMWASLSEDGSWQGEIWNRRKNGSLFLARETITAIRNTQGRLLNYMAVLIDITEAKQTDEFIRHQAYHDPLTNLPNRALFMDRLRHKLAYAHRQKTCLAVLFIDLDGFKAVNDDLGHEVGDSVLKEAAVRLKDRVRESDTVARLGGDEFTGIIDDIAGPDDAAQVAKKMLDRIAQPFLLGPHERRISASIGIALYPADRNDAVALLNAADEAMYLAKRGGRAAFAFASKA